MIFGAIESGSMLAGVGRMAISSIETIGRIGPSTPAPAGVTPTGGASFGEVLGKALETVNETNRDANSAVIGMLNGSVDVHEAMLALHEAEESLQLTIAVRNKFVQAYQDIMRMPL